MAQAPLPRRIPPVGNPSFPTSKILDVADGREFMRLIALLILIVYWLRPGPFWDYAVGFDSKDCLVLKLTTLNTIMMA